MTTKIPLGISSCLLGEEVRFDGGHKRHSYIMGTLSEYFEWRTHCPEVSIGMTIPREPIRLVQLDDVVRCRGTRDETIDVTDALIADAAAQYEWVEDLCGYIVKSNSPSCGMERVKVYNGTMPAKTGVGLFTRGIMQRFPNLPIEEEGRLGDPGLRENFIHRVLIYSRWRQLLACDPQWKQISDFHAQHKYTLMSHSQDGMRDMGRFLAQNTSMPMPELTAQYESDLMAILKKMATRRNHTNTLTHLQGYLKRELSADDKAELVETIEQYRTGLVPLIVPIVLLRHWFRKHPDPYITQSAYLYPHPAELMLLNTL